MKKTMKGYWLGTSTVAQLVKNLTATVWVGSMSRDLPYAVGANIKKKKNPDGINRGNLEVVEHFLLWENDQLTLF